MSVPHRNEAAPSAGWLQDLTEQQRNSLVGAVVHIASGARSTTGLLMEIADGVARVFRGDLGEPVEYEVSSTLYRRVPGEPARPALAHALVHQYAWDKQREELTDDRGDALNQYDYDCAKSAYEEGLSDVYDGVLAEAVRLLDIGVPSQKQATA
ncbi:hypothetical protein [Streptomyces werraensis]|uniref:hypothetical protein n=1 Tax=Streptomyces werraensis TaxID=68284 RepID=UPI0034200209